MPSQGAGDAVVLLQMGGPAHLDDIEPFLRNLFADPDIIRLPPFIRPFQPRLARRIARRRAPHVRPRYEQIGAGDGRASPILDLTRRQADGLARRLGVPVHVCMRYVPPRADEVVRALQADGARRVLLLPLYPHWSGSTTGSSLRDFARAAHRAGLEAEVHLVRDWGDHPTYVDVLAATCRETADAADATGGDLHLVLSAHSLPEKYVRRGDPYRYQVERTTALLRGRLDGSFASIRQGFQSAVGPVKWIGPETQQHIDRLARAGADAVALAPLGFVTDHIETLYDIDSRYRDQAEAHGMAVHRVPSLNDRPDFLDCLADLARGPTETLEVAAWSR